MIEGPIRKLKRRVRELETELSEARAKIDRLHQQIRDAQIGRIVTGQPKIFVDDEYRSLIEAGPREDGD